MQLNTRPEPLKILASVEETRAATGLGRTTIYELINSGVLKSVKVGKRRLVLVESINALARPNAPDAAEAR